jgi:AraC-like DNA-binding protein
MEADKNVFSLVRKFFIEYKAEFVFGLSLFAAVVVSCVLEPLIPNDIFYRIISPIQTTAIITVTLVNTWAMWRHSEGIRVRYVYAWIMGTMSVLMTAGVAYRMLVNAELQPAEGIFSFEGWEMLGADLIAWLLLAYPSELLRPGWLTIKNALKRILPVVVIGVIDIFAPLDLRWLLALVPVVWVALLFVHVRQYRKYCEENYSSTEQTDERWVIRYLVMILILGASYIYISFSEEPTRLFTEQWLMFFVLVYTNEQVIFRSKPWIEDAKKEEEADAPVVEAKIEANAEYRAKLEQWMETDKPYLNPEFRLTDLQQVLPLNRTYLSQLINTEYGCNFYQFVTNYRIEEAKRLMRENKDLQMQEIADRCGFSSPTVFSRIFVRETDMTPREWSANN